ncbi:MAG: hypothetical protein ACPHY8_03325, partial [Patescibacteria group bacterium]
IINRNLLNYRNFMFDPSKLDLDLDTLDAEKNQEKKPNESEKIKENKTKTPTEKIISDGDVLDEILNAPENNIPEESDDSEKTEFSQEKQEEPEITQEEADKNEEKKQETEKKEDEEEVQNYGSGKEVAYDKEKINQASLDEEKYNQEEKEKIIFDINMTSIKDIFVKLIEQKYDFMTVEPFDNYVKLSFRKDKIEKEVVNIKYPVYTQILIKAKTLTNLKVDVSDTSQE